MAKLVSVDNGLHLPSAVRNQLSEDLKSDMQGYVESAQSASGDAVLASDEAVSAADRAETARDEAVAIVAGDLDVANSILINDIGSDTAQALAANYGGKTYVVARGPGIDLTGVGDSTVALQAKADAAAGGILVIPDGLIVTDPISLDSNTTVILYGWLQLRAQDISTLPPAHGVLFVYGLEESRKSNVKIIFAGGGIDGNRDNITGVTSANGFDMEGINFKYTDDCEVIDPHIVNTIDSGVDCDTSTNIRITGGLIVDAGGYGVHFSNGTTDSWAIGVEVRNSGTLHSRGGFDQYIGSNPHANNNHYINCVGRDNYRNFNIQGVSADIRGCRSINGENTDIITAGPMEDGVRVEGVLTFSSGWSQGPGSDLQVELVDGMVTLNFRFDKVSNASEQETMATLPEGFRPPATLYSGALVYSGSSYTAGGLQINPGGQLQARLGGASNVTRIAGSITYRAA